MNCVNHNSISAAPKPGRAFTLLELMIVMAIIGLLTAAALPHLKGFMNGNGISAATRQMLDDVTLARQRAIANRAEVCMVFLPDTNWWPGSSTLLSTNTRQMTNLFFHQLSAYALISLRTVGDQPGRSNVHYLTDWQYLPHGVYFEPFQFYSNPPILLTNLVSTTNTLANTTNTFAVTSFPRNPYNLLPFPSTFSPVSNCLPYICFEPDGSLQSGFDQYIMLTRGSVFTPMSATPGLPAYGQPIDFVETPPNNGFANPEIIHIDWLTGRAKLEQNQF